MQSERRKFIMKLKLTVKEASKRVGLSEYAIRTGIKQGRISHIRTSGDKSKIFIDIALLEETLEQEAKGNLFTLSNEVGYGSIRSVQL